MTPTPIPAPGAASSKLRGIGWMVVTGIFFVGVTATVRHLGTSLHPIEMAFIRYVIGLVMLAPAFWRMRHGATYLPPRIGLFVARGVIHSIGVMLWFYAMSRIPIADVTALGFIAPIFTTIGAALFLGERLHARRLGAVLMGFAGAMVILRPGFEAIDMGSVAQLLAAPLFAGSFLLTKKLTETSSNATIVAFLGLFVTLALLGPAIMVWRTPTLQEMLWLTLTAIFATLGHIALVQAFRTSELSVVQPISFLQLVWATLIGLYLFDEVPDPWTWVGGAMIVGSATYIAHRESRAEGSARDREGL